MASKRTNTVRLFLQLALSGLVIFTAGGVMKGLIASKEEPKEEPTERPGPLVKAVEVKSANRPVTVKAQGSVVPARVLELQPEVSGRVMEQHPRLMPGGMVQAGDTLVRIDDRDYRLNVDRQKSMVERAAYQLQVEQGRQSIAEREWKLLERRVKSKTGEAGKALALRKPQIRNARAELSAAKSAVRQARLSLERTTIKAPFNAMVRAEAVEEGQVVSPGRPIATLVGTDVFWVQVSVPESELRWIPMPGADGEGGAEVSIYPTGREARAPRKGRVVQLMGDLDPVGRMARLLVEIKQPMVATADGAPPILLGAFVDVAIEGTEIDQVVPVPRVAVHPGDEVWVAKADNTLDIRTVQVAYRSRDEVLIKSGLESGDKVIVSRIAAPVVGMKIRLMPSGDPVALKGQGEAQEATQ
ncbi:MAG: efflux RND transporter periplasmic adaptor subunit [Bradymonadia bacterium]